MLGRRKRTRYQVSSIIKQKKQHTILRIFLLLLIMLTAISGTYIYRVLIPLSAIFHQSPTSILQQAVANKTGATQSAQNRFKTRINIALYGYGGSGHDGSFLSDSIMIVSILPHTSAAAQVAEISVPRDWYVPIDMGNNIVSWGKINEAYSDGMTNTFPNRAPQYQGEFGGGTLASDTLSKLLGIHIDYFIGIDFHAFQYAVDAVGGIDVNVPNTFTDYAYPRGECVPGGDCSLMTVHFDAGMQHMDGKTALIFSRSRHSNDNGEGTDFARSRRQQLVTQALKEKVLSLGGISSLPQILESLQGHVETNMAVQDAYDIYDLTKNVPSTAIERVSLDDTNFLYECGYPKNCNSAYIYAHDPTYATLSHFANNIFPTPQALANAPDINVVDGSGYGNGADRRWAAILSQLGLHAHAGGQQQSTNSQTQVSASNPQDKPLADWLTQYFSAQEIWPATFSAPPSNAFSIGVNAVSKPDVVTLVIGSSEEDSFYQQQGKEGRS